MKKQEAVDLIRTKLEEGLEKEAIVEILTKDGKVGSYNLTDELIDELFAEAGEPVKAASPPPQPADPTYEEWAVRKENGQNVRVKKVKDVRISDDQASILNRQLSTIQYYKKEEYA